MSAAQLTASRRRVAGRVVLYALVLLFTLQAAFPFAWGLITTFKSSPDLYSRDNNPFLFNEPPTLDHVKLCLLYTSPSPRDS